jgi:hypothetical protein
MAHLFGVIGLRGGVCRRMPLLGDANSRASRRALRGSSPGPLSIIVVVSALQSELHDRRASSLLALGTLHIANNHRVVPGGVTPVLEC